MKKPTKKALRNKADKLCGQLARSIGKCENCGDRENLQWCHIMTRGIGKLRYERRNWLCLCASCHRHFHNKPLQFTKFIGEIKGKDIVDWLIIESNKLEPLTVRWYQNVIEDIELKLSTGLTIDK
jgi:hypothetical protein